MAAVVTPGTPAPADQAVTEQPVVESPATEAEGGEEGDSESRLEQALAEMRGEKPKEEAKPKVEEKPKEEVPSIEEQSRSFAALRHKTKRFEEERANYNAEKAKNDAAHAERLAALEKREAEFNARVERAAKTPLEALMELGWSPEQLREYIEKEGVIPPERMYQTLEKKFQAELDKIRGETKKQQEEREALEAANKKARDAELIAGFERKVGTEIVEIVSEDMAKFPQLRKLLRTTKGARMVHRGVLNQLAEAHTSKKPIAISDALVQAEKEAAELFDDGSDPQQAGAVQPANPGSIEPIPKLDTARRGVAPKKELDELTAEEREELALRELRGTG